MFENFCPYLKGIGYTIISVGGFLVGVLGEFFRSGFWRSVGEGIFRYLHHFVQILLLNMLFAAPCTAHFRKMH